MVGAAMGVMMAMQMISGDWQQLTLVLVLCASVRGFLRYGEQYMNHWIAFKLLALIRHHVFAQLRHLAPQN